MNFGVYISFFFLSMVKFMFTPFAGPAAGLSFFQTYFICVSGAITCSAFFYYMSEWFMKRVHKKRVAINKEALRTNKYLSIKKKFTLTNKLIVKTKSKLGIIGIAIFAPLFFSVPIGSIVAAKFYGKDKRTFPLIVIGMLINGLITTGISYLLLHHAK